MKSNWVIIFERAGVLQTKVEEASTMHRALLSIEGDESTKVIVAFREDAMLVSSSVIESYVKSKDGSPGPDSEGKSKEETEKC